MTDQFTDDLIIPTATGGMPIERAFVDDPPMRPAVKPKEVEDVHWSRRRPEIFYGKPGSPAPFTIGEFKQGSRPRLPSSPDAERRPTTLSEEAEGVDTVEVMEEEGGTAVVRDRIAGRVTMHGGGEIIVYESGADIYSPVSFHDLNRSISTLKSRYKNGSPSAKAEIRGLGKTIGQVFSKMERDGWGEQAKNSLLNRIYREVGPDLAREFGIAPEALSPVTNGELADTALKSMGFTKPEEGEDGYVEVVEEGVQNASILKGILEKVPDIALQNNGDRTAIVAQLVASSDDGGEGLIDGADSYAVKRSRIEAALELVDAEEDLRFSEEYIQHEYQKEEAFSSAKSAVKEAVGMQGMLNSLYSAIKAHPSRRDEAYAEFAERLFNRRQYDLRSGNRYVVNEMGFDPSDTAARLSTAVGLMGRKLEGIGKGDLQHYSNLKELGKDAEAKDFFVRTVASDLVANVLNSIKDAHGTGLMREFLQDFQATVELDPESLSTKYPEFAPEIDQIEQAVGIGVQVQKQRQLQKLAQEQEERRVKDIDRARQILVTLGMGKADIGEAVSTGEKPGKTGENPKVSRPPLGLTDLTHERQLDAMEQNVRLTFSHDPEIMSYLLRNIHATRMNMLKHLDDKFATAPEGFFTEVADFGGEKEVDEFVDTLLKKYSLDGWFTKRDDKLKEFLKSGDPSAQLEAGGQPGVTKDGVPLTPQASGVGGEGQ